ncbi:alpha/beta hydrolase fold domain-containing protein [Streptosporangium nondiastaticum]|uniref:alpha/beta hydrolase fold domain-containing protein n=2 Tax=Streptosporangiaceae TaxID=2004 RepID=UPI0035EE9B4B
MPNMARPSMVEVSMPCSTTCSSIDPPVHPAPCRHAYRGVDPYFAPAGIEWLFDRYAAGSDRPAPELSPVFADLTGLPPLLIQAGSSELLPDDAVRPAGRAGAGARAPRRGTRRLADRPPASSRPRRGPQEARGTGRRTDPVPHGSGRRLIPWSP